MLVDLYWTTMADPADLVAVPFASVRFPIDLASLGSEALLVDSDLAYSAVLVGAAVLHAEGSMHELDWRLEAAGTDWTSAAVG